MATPSELMAYQGSGGLGSNAGIPVTSGKPLEFVNTVLRDVAVRDHQKSIINFQQQVNDRDKLIELASSGKLKVPDILERDTPIVHKSLDEIDKAYVQMIKDGGLSNLQAVGKYKAAVRAGEEHIAQAIARKISADKENAVIGSERIPKYANARKQNLEKNLSSFWSDIVPFQETTRLDLAPIEKFAEVTSESFSDPTKPMYKGTRKFYSFDNALSNATKYSLTPEGFENLQTLHNSFTDLQPVEFIDKVKTINKELDRYNKERGLTVGSKDYAAPVKAVQLPNGRWGIQEPLESLAAKISLSGQQKYNEEGFDIDKGALDIAKQKLDEKELRSLDNYRRGQLAIDRDRLSFDKKKAEKAGVTPDAAYSAKAYAVALFGKLSSLADANGNISSDKLKSLTEEERKYLGQSVVEENKFKLNGLDLSSVSSMRVTPEGSLEITRAKTTGIGKEKKTVNETITVDPKQVAGNKLGEEMTITAGKEGINYNDLTELYSLKPVPGQTAPTAADYSNVTTLKGPDGKDIQAGVKNGKWYDIKTGKELK